MKAWAWAGMWGSQSWLQPAFQPAGIRSKAGPQAELPAPQHRFRAWVALLAALVALEPARLQAQGGERGGGQDLSTLSLEELTRLQVSSLNRKDQRLSRVAGAVYVITHEEILRSGLSSIPEILRRVPGLQVAQIDSNKWAVSARGFSGRFSNKMLVMIDGRAVYDPLYSGVYWDQNDTLIEDIERIEVIRGPGATMWGANAVNGVINVITRKARDTQGGLVVAETGNQVKGGGAVRYGGQRGDQLSYRVYSKFGLSGEGMPSVGGGFMERWNSMRGGVRVDYQATARDTLTFDGDIYRGRVHQIINYNFPMPEMQPFADCVHDEGGYVQAKWQRRLRGSDIALQSYYNQEDRRELMADSTMRTLDIDFQQHIGLWSRHDVVWGAGYRDMHSRVGGSLGILQPPERRQRVYSAFLEDDYSLVPNRVVLSLGTKFQHNDDTGIELQPGVRILWTPSERHSLWASVARAVRTPSVRDNDLDVRFHFPKTAGFDIMGVFRGAQGRALSETLVAQEAGYRSQLTPRFSIDLAGFVNRYGHLQSIELGQVTLVTTPAPHVVVPLLSANSYAATTYGAEAAVNWTATNALRVRAGYGWIVPQFSERAGPTYLNLPEDSWMTPRNTASMTWLWDVTRRLSADATIYLVGPLESPMGVSSGAPQLGTEVPAGTPQYWRADARVAWKLGERGEIAGGVRNLEGGSHLEFRPDDYSVPSLMRRTAYVKLLWTF